MGRVFRARQVALDRVVALKVLTAHLAADPAYVTRFRNEAALAAKLNHAGIVQIYAAGESDGTHYLAMEFVEGESLRKRLEKVGRLPFREAIAMCLKVAEALAYAWNKSRIIHRDVKPDNIFLATDGAIKIGDLGLAKAMGGSTHDITEPGSPLGTPYYISPEQAKGDRSADFRADVYSLGCTLFHMLAGQPPFKGGSGPEILVKHIHDPPPDIRPLMPGCPPEIPRLLGRMLDKSPDRRHGTYEELIGELKGIAEPSDEAPAPGHRHLRIAALAGAAALAAGLLLPRISRLAPADGTGKAALESAITAVAKPSGTVLAMAYGAQPPPAPAEYEPPAARLELLARRRGTKSFSPLKDGDPVASGADDYIVALHALTDGYLYVFQIDSTGNLAWLYPSNPASKFSSGSNPVSKGQLVQIPARERGRALFLDNNLGVEHIYAVFSAARWLEFELALGQAPAIADATRPKDPITLPFGLATRGVGGIRAEPDPAPYLPLEQPFTATGTKLPINTPVQAGRGPMIVLERWFKHVPPAP